ncbi:probable aspartic proteinase GIP2 [Humulus lupulus]|uniref:probable aspartic proteinase GIP2 n=1 Tax=Humulus lupulus TaxID=3486 RepID=UPI002B40509F|nr:probable aspartic proteinase GIP2 [Humulus lupulus]
MASGSEFSFLLFLSISFFFFFLASTNINVEAIIINSINPSLPPFTSLYMPIQKDNSTLQYHTTVEWGSEENYFDVVIDLGGEFLSLPCDTNNKSTTYSSIKCGSTKCTSTCKANDSCVVSFLNPFNETVLSGRLSEDGFAAVPSDGDRISRDSYLLTTSHHHNLIPFTCLDSSSLNGLAQGDMGRVSGIIGFGGTKMSFAKNLASSFQAPHRDKFAVCLPSTNVGLGVVFIGGGPYWFDPYWVNGSMEASKWLDYTPLSINTLGEYFIGVKSIKIDKRVVHFNTSLLSHEGKTGLGRTKISTSTPYTILHTSIYNAVVGGFVKSAAARNITRVAAVAKFGVCFNTKNVVWSKEGPRVPVIDLELEAGNGTRRNGVTWRIIGANSMVGVNKNVMCLGFIDGGSKATTSIGGLQLEDNLLEFDLNTSMLGFTSSFLPRETRCTTDRLFQPDD